MRGITLSAAITASILSGPVMADTFSYNQIDLKLMGINRDDGNDDNDITGLGLGMTGSWEFTSHVFGYAGLSGLNYLYEGEFDFAAEESSLGIGFNMPLGPRLDFIAGGSFERTSLIDEDYEGISEYSGYGLRAGVRGLIGRCFDWHAGVNYLDVGSFDETTVGAGFRLMLSPRFGVGLDLASSDSHGVSTGRATIGFRFQFGDRN